MAQSNQLGDGTPIPEEFMRVLQEQTIDEEHPGPILRDFGALLDFIGTEGISIRDSKRGFFPNKIIEELNSRMSRPMRHSLKRTTQASFPKTHLVCRQINP